MFKELVKNIIDKKIELRDISKAVQKTNLNDKIYQLEYTLNQFIYNIYKIDLKSIKKIEADLTKK